MIDYKMTELDHKILKVCETPKASRQIADELCASYKTVQWKLGRLKMLGLVKSIRSQKKNDEFHGYRYIRVENATMPEQAKKPYQPLGMCILGVWL